MLQGTAATLFAYKQHFVSQLQTAMGNGTPDGTCSFSTYCPRWIFQYFFERYGIGTTSCTRTTARDFFNKKFVTRRLATTKVTALVAKIDTSAALEMFRGQFGATALGKCRYKKGPPPLDHGGKAEVTEFYEVTDWSGQGRLGRRHGSEVGWGRLG